MRKASATMMLPAIEETTKKDAIWFGPLSYVESGAEKTRVFVGGRLVGEFGREDRGIRNTLLLGLCQERRFRKDRLGAAFGVSHEQLRRIRQRFAEQGEAGISRRGPGGSKPKVTEPVRERLYRLFEEGLGPTAALRKLGRRFRISRPTVSRVRGEWLEEQRQAAEPHAAAIADKEPELFADATAAEPVAAEPEERVAVAPVRGGREVQHLGTWLLLGMLERQGLYEAAQATWEGAPESLRVTLDAVVCALALGERCVEGVRRLETPSAAVLLRARRAPSESWVRRVLKRYVDEEAGARLMLAMTARQLAEAAAEEPGVAVYYVDNHLRRYTGKQTTRRGWRMQDKRVVPGSTDYYVHDEDGRAVFRAEAPDNAPLTAWLTPVTRMLRQGLGREQRILVAFDRAGAYPEQLAELRDEGFEFVTYERRPYPLLTASEFTETVRVGDEEYGLHEGRLHNLKGGRGRVRRIALRTPDDHQVNLLAVSAEPAARLVEVMTGRWVQENAFKHGNERWGVNQLDRRRVEHYSPETVIPNPARRRLDHALMLARHREGELRSSIARLADGDQRLVRARRDLADVIAEQETLLALRPSTPKHAPLAETELAGNLVYHPGEYKSVIDTLRIACANAESELALELAPQLRKPREAKKALANLLAAPGRVRVSADAIRVTLSPAARDDEREALAALCGAINEWKLVLPGDPRRRPLRFQSQLS
jgi:hypothetical protein